MDAANPIVDETPSQHGARLAKTYLERSRRVAEIIKAARDRIETERELPADVLDAMHKSELWRMALPAFLGGAELSPPALARMLEIIAEADASAAWCLGQATGCAMSAAFLDQEPARRVFGPPDAILSWGAGIMGRAIVCEGGYRISGTWKFASSSRHATWMGGHCMVFESDGSPRLLSDGTHADRTALFPRDAAEFDDDWKVLGLRGTRSESYTVTELFVPDELTLERENPLECRSSAPLFVFPQLWIYAACFSGVALGIARGIVDDLVELARTKTQRAVEVAMRDSPVFHSRIAEIEARLGAARAYQQVTLEEIWEEVRQTMELTPVQNTRIRLVTSHAINESTRVTEQAYRLAGSTAIFENLPFERRFRDMHAVSQQMHGRHNHYETVGRFIMGVES